MSRTTCRATQYGWRPLNFRPGLSLRGGIEGLGPVLGRNLAIFPNPIFFIKPSPNRWPVSAAEQSVNSGEIWVPVLKRLQRSAESVPRHLRIDALVQLIVIYEKAGRRLGLGGAHRYRLALSQPPSPARTQSRAQLKG
jgi:hypothetical protein